MNKQFFDVNGLVEITAERTGERIEVFPCYFVDATRPRATVTEKGRDFLRGIIEWMDDINEEDVIRIIHNAASTDNSGWADLEADALFSELFKMIR